MTMKMTKAATAAAADEKLFITDDVTALTILMTVSLLIPSNAVGSHGDSALKLVLSIR